MRFNTIVVPRGAEARAVEQGWPRPRPIVLTVPAGSAAGDALAAAHAGTTALVLGLCGAIDPALRVGDAVAYARIVDGTQTLELDPELTGACVRAVRCSTVNAVAVNRVVGDVAAKSALRAATSAAVIDMEAASIARALRACGARVAMLRIVSDDAASELPDLRDVYDRNGALRPLALGVAFARAPRRSVHFIASVLQALAALRATANVLARTTD